MSEINTAQINEELAKLSEALRSASGGMYQSLAEVEKEDLKTQRKKNAQDFVEALKQTSKQLGSAGVQFVQTMHSSQQGMHKYAGSITAAGSAISDFAGKFGILGKIVGGVATVFTKLFTSALKQNDELISSFNELSSLGSLTSGGIQELNKQLLSIGLTSETAATFAKVISRVNSELAVFGVGASEGRKKLVGITEPFFALGSKYEFELARLGYSTDEMREGVASYISSQIKMDHAQKRSTSDLAKEAQKYMVTLKQLQELTGLSADEQQKAIEQAQADARFNMMLSTMDREEAENLKLLMPILREFGPTITKGVQEFLYSGGSIVSDEVATVFRSFPNIGQELLNVQRTGAEGIAKFTKNFSSSMMEVFGPNGPLYSSIMVSTDAFDTLTGGHQAMNTAMKFNQMSLKQAVDATKKANDLKGKENKEVDEAVKARQKERSLIQSYQTMLQKVSGFFVAIMEKVQTVMFHFGKFLATMIEKFGPKIGIDIKPGELTNFFKTPEELSKDLAAQMEKTSAIQQKIDARQRELEGIKSGTITGDTYKKLANEAKKDIQKLQDEAIIFADNPLYDFEKAQKQLKELKNAEKTYADLSKQSSEQQYASRKEALEREIKLLEEQKKQEKEISDIVNQRVSLTDTKRLAPNVQYSTTSIGTRAPEEVIASRQSAQKELATLGAGRESTILKSLNLKSPESIAGGKAEPQTLAMAEKIQNKFAELGKTVKFTALNDAFHKQQYPNSKHTIGKALDFAISPAPANIEEAKVYKEILKDLGAYKVLDEYFEDKNEKTTAGHFHVEVAKFGGKFSGPEMGYPVMLHGKESVWPEKELSSLLNEVKKSSLTQYKEELLAEVKNQNTTTPMVSGITNNQSSLSDMIGRSFDDFGRKLDVVIGVLERTHNVQDELLTYTKA